MSHKIALIGFGTVGQGLCEILIDKKEYLKSKYDFSWEIVAISDPVKGSVYCSSGLEVEKLLKLAATGTSLEEYQCQHDNCKCNFGWDALKTIKDSNADTICELAFTNVETGMPAIDHCKAAFESGKNVVTSNKGPAAVDFAGMQALADENGVKFMIEGTVVSGTPIINLVDGPLAGCEISSIKGILNGTTNYILTQMEAGMEYSTALQKDQELGYAEADPTGDVEGFDAMAKVIILANVVMNTPITAKDVEREGITGITPAMIADAKAQNARWKLIGSIEKTVNGVKAAVKPEMVPMTHPLAGIMDATNALTFATDLMGDITIVGAGAGRTETGYSILTDILAIHRNN
ncbi:MAG: homoserine dehydrogenase [Candidatus Marinimicrobia bacterium]|nr:homoserine dehydrogenase [Candidatus Neomarinimicrobiota bacterium]